MPAALAFLPRMHLWTVLLLAAIGLQAAEPIRAPLDRTPGSAFSAATLDVAVVSSRRAAAEAFAAQPAPAAPALLPSQSVPEYFSSSTVAKPGLRPWARGPPPRSHPARLPDSTAPPFA